MKVVSAAKQLLLPSEHELFNHCHASTIVRLPDGQFLAAFFAGLREGEGDVAIWLARGKDGIWQAPQRLISENGVAHWNPVLHVADDTVWILYMGGPTVHDWVTRKVISRDGGYSWTEPKALVPGDVLPRGPVRNKLLVMSNGQWLAPGSIETEDAWDAFVDISNDFGKTWLKHDVPIDHCQRGVSGSGEIWAGLADNALWETDAERVFKWDGVIQPTLWESKPGRIHMLMRSTRGWIYRSDSEDFGRTWCPAYATSLPNNNSGIDLVMLADRRLVLAFNPIAGNWGRRSPISLACSDDNGEHWERLLDMETEEGEFSYPAIIADGFCLHVTYTANRKNIVYREVCVE
jgi:predicted neuraminidase